MLRNDSMNGITRNLMLTILMIISVSLVAIATPFEYKICNLGWKHVHHNHNEEAYQQAWCSMHNGIMSLFRDFAT